MYLERVNPEEPVVKQRPNDEMTDFPDGWERPAEALTDQSQIHSDHNRVGLDVDSDVVSSRR